MATSWFTNVGGTWNIYSIGDGTYMKHVLDGVAMLSNDGVLLSLGKLGLMLGLLVYGVKAVASGLQKLEIGYFLVSILVFATMFGMRTNVLIHDMGGAPGVFPGGTYPVNNVPFGVAVAGSIVSTLGLDLAQSLDQAFGLPSGTGGGISSGGFGESLRWINAVRNWDLPEIDSNQGDVSWYKWNVSQYLANCYMPAVDNGLADVGKTFQVANPWQMGNSNTGGLGVSNQFNTTQIRDSVGIHTFPCSQAYGGLAVQTSGTGAGSIYNAFASTLSPRGMKLPTGTSDPATALTQAFQDINMDATAAQMYTMTAGLQAAWADMMRHNGQNSSLDTLSDLMVSQAAQQRATQWGAAESMFRRVAQPAIAFFESMFYACAPFMALCIGFGSWGFQMVMRYLILTIWVTLWFPVLSIINLFQLTMVHHAVDAMTVAGTQLPNTSFAGSAYLQSQIVDWLSVGALLASSTPAITLMLIFGGAVSAGAIASKLSGDSHVDAKAVSPDAVKNSSALSTASMFTGTMGGGVAKTGTESTQPKIELGDSASVRATSTDTSRATSAQSFNAQWGEKVATQWAANHSGGVNASHNVSSDTSESEKRVGNALRSMGVNVNSGSEAAWSAVASVAASAGADAAVKFAGSLGLTAGLKGQDQESVQANMKRAFQEMNDNKTSRGHELQVATSQSIGDMASQNASSSGSKNDSVTGDQSFSKGLSDVKQKDAAYQEASSQEQSYKHSQGMSVNQMAKNIQDAASHDPTLAKDLATAAASLGGSAAAENRAAVKNANWAPADAGAQAIAGDLLTLSGKSFGGGSLPAAYAGDRAEKMMEIAQRAGFVGASTSGEAVIHSDPGHNQGGAASVTPGQAEQAVGGHSLGTPADAHSIKAESGALMSGNPAAAGPAMAGVIQSAGAGGVNAVDQGVLHNPSTQGQAAVDTFVDNETKPLVTKGREAQAQAAQVAKESGSGETARTASAVAYGMTHFSGPGATFMGGGAGAFMNNMNHAEGMQKSLAEDFTPAQLAAQNAAVDATYAKYAENPGAILGADKVSSPAMGRALAGVATSNESKIFSPKVAAEVRSAMSELNETQREAVKAIANAHSVDSIPSWAMSAAVGGPVSGVKN